jgi:nucleoside-diphosphate-sugar epimerase
MMGYRIFLADASGAIGSRLTPLLHSAGHRLRPIRDYTSQFPCSDTPSLPFECTKSADCSVVV